MFRIEDNRPSFYQWDLNQRLRCSVDAGCQVHFANNQTMRAMIMEAYEEDGQVYVDVPNILLQFPQQFYVYAYPASGNEMHTECASVFSVIPRVRPDSYMYEETEVQSWETVSQAALDAVQAVIAQVQEKLDNGELKGEKGDTGAKGNKGEKGDPFTYADFTPEQLALLKGEQGKKGEKGERGEKGEQGDGVPTVTAEDNGKVLQVLNGTWTAAEVATGGGGNGVADWNQNDPNGEGYIRNRPFYTTEPQLADVLQETTLNCVIQGNIAISDIESDLTIPVGDSAVVVLDDVSYPCVVKYSDMFDMTYLGNVSVVGAPDTGETEPFFLGFQEPGLPFAVQGTVTQHTLSIKAVAPTHVKIPNKYLPLATDEEYGLVKTGEYIKCYRLSNYEEVAVVEQAIRDFNTGKAIIIANGSYVIEASVINESKTIQFVYANSPHKRVNIDASGSHCFIGHNDLFLSSNYGFVEASNVNLFNKLTNGYDSITINHERISVPGNSGRMGMLTTNAGALKVGAYADSCYLTSTALYLKGKNANNENKTFKIAVENGTLSATEVQT